MQASDVGLIFCTTCELAQTGRSETKCLRCGTRLNRRRPRSLQRCFAWLTSGLIFYVPANVLPVMHTSWIGGGQDSTILGGVVSFWRAGVWDIALIIFTASVAVPACKFLGLGWILWTVHRGRHRGQAARGKLHRFVEYIGYWSMLDVAVVALSATLLQFGSFGRAEPRIGILFFCAVVVTTMISALYLDPRLIWDQHFSRGE